MTVIASLSVAYTEKKSIQILCYLYCNIHNGIRILVQCHCLKNWILLKEEREKREAIFDVKYALSMIDYRLYSVNVAIVND